MTNIISDFVVGGVARNDDYYFHKTFLSDVWDSLKKDNVLLLSPRRSGKTSVMYRMLDHPENGYRVIHLNVEDLDTPASHSESELIKPGKCHNNKIKAMA